MRMMIIMLCCHFSTTVLLRIVAWGAHGLCSYWHVLSFFDNSLNSERCVLTHGLRSYWRPCRNLLCTFWHLVRTGGHGRRDRWLLPAVPAPLVVLRYDKPRTRVQLVECRYPFICLFVPSHPAINAIQIDSAPLRLLQLVPLKIVVVNIMN